MANIHVEYDRKLTDSEINGILRRSTNTLSVLQQLGADFQKLPGFSMADVQAKSKEVAGALAALQELTAQIAPLLKTLDEEGAALDAFDKGLLQMLRGALAGKPEASLLDQITGPTTQSPPPAPKPPTP